MRTKYLIIITTITILLASCGGSDRISHDKTTLSLRSTKSDVEVIFQTEIADFHFDKAELVAYCQKENDGEPNDFTFPQIIEYIENFDDTPITILDTLGTKMAKASEVLFNESDSLIRVRDKEHPYAYIADDIRWAIIEFASKGKLRIYHKESNSFLNEIILDKVEASYYGETNITMTNDTVIFSVLNWIS